MRRIAAIACAALLAAAPPLRAAADPEPSRAALDAIRKARELEAEGKKSEARALLADLLAREPDPVAALELGNRLFEADDLAGAAKAYRRAIALAPQFAMAHKNLGRTLYRQEDYGSAADHIALGIEAGGPDTESLIVLADARERTGAHAEAAWAYRFALALRPGDARCRQGLLNALIGSRRYAEAGELCRELLCEDPRDAALWRLRAQIAAAAGRLDEAADALEALRILAAAGGDDLGLLGDVYLGIELPREAAEAYGEAAKAGPLGPHRSMARAAALLAAGELEEAARVAEALPEEVAGGAEGVTLRARIAAARGKLEEADALFAEAVRVRPLDGKLLLAAARFRWGRGDTDGAVALLRAASLIDVSREAALRDLVRLFIERGETEAALRAASEALEARDDEALRQLKESLERIRRR
ncbi:MAG: tetratricopeptide repeat protein [Planctomycetes bacterium]|nr:tetratricopeptide repeat protein [Planctomycetota bacterium]